MTRPKEGTTEALEAIAIERYKRHTSAIEAERARLQSELAVRKIDRFDIQNSPPLDAAMQETLLHVFDVMVYYSFFKKALSDKFSTIQPLYL
jgi:hypothetical protein